MKKWLLILVIVILNLVLVEGILRANQFVFNIPFYEEDIPFINRVIHKDTKIYQFDFQLFWKFRPNIDDINSLGFRDKEFSIHKNSDLRFIPL